MIHYIGQCVTTLYVFTEYEICLCLFFSLYQFRVLANYMMWLLLMDMAPETTEALEQQEHEYLRILQVCIMYMYNIVSHTHTQTQVKVKVKEGHTPKERRRGAHMPLSP